MASLQTQGMQNVVCSPLRCQITIPQRYREEVLASSESADFTAL